MPVHRIESNTEAMEEKTNSFDYIKIMDIFYGKNNIYNVKEKRANYLHYI